MNGFRRGGTPLKSAIPSLEASNQAQIDDLVQRNRTLEHTNKKLGEQLQQDGARAKEHIHDLQRQWEHNQAQWKAGCEDLLSSYRIVQKKIEVDLERERSAVFREMKITREEKLQRLHRDYKIKLFQINEAELQRKIEDLEDDKASLEEEYEDTLRQERERAAEYAAKWKEAKEALARVTRERDAKEAKYTKLQAEHSNLDASSNTLDTKLQRTQLQLEGAQTRVADLERTNDELKRANADLSRQIERWENLENKGGQAAEKQHKKIIELELELRELRETSAAEKEKHDVVVGKLTTKVEKYKATFAEFQESIDMYEKDAEEYNKDIQDLEHQVESLKAELEQLKSRPAADDAPEAPPKPKANASKPKPSSSSDAGLSKPRQPGSQTARKSTGGKPPPQSKLAVIDEVQASGSDEEVEEVLPPQEEGAPQSKPKPKPRVKKADQPETTKRTDTGNKGKGKGKAVEEAMDEDDGEDDGVHEVIPSKRPASKRAPANPAKRKPPVEDGDDDVVIVDKPKKKGAATATASKKKDGAKAVAATSDSEDAPPKKKKKINLFPTVKAPGPFAFDSLTHFGDAGGLNIPSTLSPVKPDAPVPARSTSAAFSRLR